jgi:demethylphylloquinone reductase
MSPVKICILGGGFGGLYTALHLSKLSKNTSKLAKITLVDDKDHFLFTPLLYELVTDEISRREIAPSFDRLLKGTNINFCQGQIQAVDLEIRQISIDTPVEQITLDYDLLVIAVGRESNFHHICGAAQYSYTFRTLADLERLKAKLNTLKIRKIDCGRKLQIAIIGSGASGVELACKLGDFFQQSVQIFLIDRGRTILNTFPNQVRRSAEAALAHHDILVELETTINSIEPDRVTTFSQDKINLIPVDLVIWTAGTKSIEWVRKLKCPHNNLGGLSTLTTLQLVNHPEVFALGDVAAIRDIRGESVPATAQAAVQQAKCVAINIFAIQSGRPLRHFRYFYLGEMLTLGINLALVSSFGLNLEGRLACSIRRLVYLQRLLTFRHRLPLIQNSFNTKIFEFLSRCDRVRSNYGEFVRMVFMNPLKIDADPSLERIIIFDGICNLCNGFVNFVIGNDPNRHFKFTSSQSEIGRSLLQKFNFSTIPETIILIEAGHCYTHSTAVLRIFKHLHGLLYCLNIIPRSIRDPIYNWVARNRYQWMGTSNICRILTPELEDRFLK